MFGSPRHNFSPTPAPAARRIRLMRITLWARPVSRIRCPSRLPPRSQVAQASDGFTPTKELLDAFANELGGAMAGSCRVGLAPDRWCNEP
jgi:hypothetical protein